MINNCYKTLCFVSTFIFLFGCQINYIDPGTGRIDPNRNYKTEGLLSAMLSLVGNGARFAGKDKPEKTICFDNQSPHYSSSESKAFSQLSAHLEAYNLQHLKFNNILMVSIPYEGSFETDAIFPNESSLQNLSPIVNLLAQNDRFIIEIAGHADYQGTSRYNQKLSRLRAINMARYLASNGINKERLFFVGFGEDYLSPFGKDAKRVELFICEKPALFADL